MDCPGADTIVDYLAEGELSASMPSLDEHLDRCVACRELFALLVASGVRRRSAQTEPAARAPFDALPRTIGRYRIDGLLGAGGMAVVMAAWDPRLSRRVAIKLLRPQSRARADPAATARLLREARVLAASSHPNVVPVFEVGMIDAAVPGSSALVYIVMELVDGATLREWMGRGPHPWRSALEIFGQAARGLAAAHAAGVVHRDFKPENVIIGRDGRVRVMDFGLAALDDRPSDSIDASDSARTGVGPRSLRLTQTGYVMGTPAYMSPEQDKGATVDARSDQFSFCVTLFEALHGERPFQGPTPTALAVARGDGRIVEVAPRDVPRRIDAAIRRGLARDPRDRWPDMNTLMHALRPARPGVWVWTVTVGAVALGLAGAVASSAEEPPERCGDVEAALSATWSPAVRSRIRAAFVESRRAYADDASDHAIARLEHWASEWREARSEACASALDLDARLGCFEAQRRRADEITALFVDADATIVENAAALAALLPDPRGCADGERDGTHARVTRGATEPIVRRLDRAEAELAGGRAAAAYALAQSIREDAEALAAPALVARADLVAGSAAATQARFADARASLERVFFEAIRLGADLMALDAATRLVSTVGVDLGEPEAAREWVRHADAAWERLGRPPRARADLLQNIGSLELALGRHAEALAAVSEARDLYSRLDPDGVGDRLARATQNAGTIELQSGRLPEAEQAFLEALPLYEAVVGRRHPHVATLINNLGIVTIRQGRSEQGVELLREALEIRRAAYGDEHPEVGATMANLGIALDRLGRPREALDVLTPAVAIFRRAYGDEHPVVASAFYNEATAHFHAGASETAREGLRRARRIWEQTLGPEHAAVAGAMAMQGNVERAGGDLDTALALHERAHQIRRDALGEAHPDTLLSLGELAADFRAKGDWTRALELFEQQVEAGQAIHGPDAASLAFPLTARGECLLALGRPDEAVAVLERALALREAADPGPALLAETRVYLSRALREGSGDGVRGGRLLDQAIAEYESAGEAHAEALERARALQHAGR